MPLQDNPSTAAAAPLQTSAPPQQLSVPEQSTRASKSSRRPHSVSGSATAAASVSNVTGAAASKRASNSKPSQKQLQQQSAHNHAQESLQAQQNQIQQAQQQAQRRAQVQSQQQHQSAHHSLQHVRQLSQTQGSVAHSGPVQLHHNASQSRLHPSVSSSSAAAPAFTAALAAMASKPGTPQSQPQVNNSVAMIPQYQYQLHQQLNAARQQAAQQQTHPSQSLIQPDFALDTQTQFRNQQAYLQHQSSHFAMQSSNPSSLFANVAQIPTNQALNSMSPTLRQQPAKHEPTVTETASTLRQPPFSTQQALNPGVGAGPFIGTGLNATNGAKPEHLFATPPSSRSKLRHERQYAAKSPIVKLIGIGPCVQQLMKFNVEQRNGQIKNSVEKYWKPFVHKFFAPNATILLDFIMPQSGNPTRSIELPVEVMPHFFKSKYDAGVSEDRLLMEAPFEFLLENGIVVVDCPRTTMLTTYQNSKVCTDGHLRVSFTKEKKIIVWEFTTQRHEELFNRDVISKSPTLPKPVCTPYGIPASAVLLLAIAESINDMKPALDNHIFKQLNDAASIFPGEVAAKPKQNHEAALQQNVDVIPPDFALSSPPPGLTLFGPDQSGSSTLQQSPQSLVHMQLQMQAQAPQQQMQSNHLNLDPSSSRIHPNSIRSMQANHMPHEMMRGIMENAGFRNHNGANVPVQLRNTGSATTEGLLGHSVALQASLSGGIGGVSDVGSLFPDPSPPSVEHAGDANTSVLSQLKASSPVGPPSGLSLFAPSGPGQDITPDMFAPVANRGLAPSSGSTLPQVGSLGEALGDGMFSTQLFQLDQFKSAANGVPGSASAHAQGNPNGASAASAAAAVSPSPGAGGSKRSAAGGVGNASKRRRSVTHTGSPL